MSLEVVTANLNSAIQQIRGCSEKGLLKAGLQIQEIAMPLTPIQFGFLRNGFVVTSEPDDGQGNPVACIANTVSYAPFVHENLTAHHPRGGQAKFLETAIDQNTDLILQTIADEAHL